VPERVGSRGSTGSAACAPRSGRPPGADPAPGEQATPEPAVGIFVGGLEKQPVVLVDHRPEWAARFAAERVRIQAALGAVAVRVEHIGSTAVPGLAAKPIVDIQVAVPDVADEPSFVGALHAAGYLTRVRESGEHWMFRTAAKDVHVHVCAAGGDWEYKHLLFRDWLRHDPADRAAYEAVKRRLAAQDWPSMQHYAEAKSQVVHEIIARAVSWAAAVGWTVAA
jgi:GrpB-like predicted nucleotidyltransferase (UPF0157 family)